MGQCNKLQAGHFLANVFCTFAVEGYGILHRPRHLSGTQKALAIVTTCWMKRSFCSLWNGCCERKSLMWQNIVVELLILGFIPKRHCSQRVRYPKNPCTTWARMQTCSLFLFLTRGIVGAKMVSFFATQKRSSDKSNYKTNSYL